MTSLSDRPLKSGRYFLGKQFAFCRKIVYNKPLDYNTMNGGTYAQL